MSEDLKPDIVDSPPILTPWEVRRIQDKLNKGIYGKDRIVVAFTCNWTTQISNEPVGQPFTMADAEGGRQVIGEVFHMFRERHLVAVLVANDKVEFVKACLIREANRRNEKARAIAEGREPQPTSQLAIPPGGSAVVDCNNCAGLGFRLDHYSDCPDYCELKKHYCRTCKGTGEVLVALQGEGLNTEKGDAP